MPNYDSVKTQYRNAHRTNTLKKGSWSLFETPDGKISLLEGKDLKAHGLQTVLRGVETLSENRVLAIMQELAAEFA